MSFQTIRLIGTRISTWLLVVLVAVIAIPRAAALEATPTPTQPPYALESFGPQLLRLSRQQPEVVMPVLTADQAKKLLEAVKPWQDNAFLAITDAKAVYELVEAILTPEQKAWKPAITASRPAGEGVGQNGQFRAVGGTGQSVAAGQSNRRPNLATENFEQRRVQLIGLIVRSLQHTAGIEVPVSQATTPPTAAPGQARKRPNGTGRPDRQRPATN